MLLPVSPATEVRAIFAKGGKLLKIKWRREWDSNPRYLAVNTLSKRAPSATRPSLQLELYLTSVAEQGLMGRRLPAEEIGE